MADVFTKAKRSEVMSRIRGRGNKDTELALMKLLRRHHINGWRRNQSVFGKPDFVFPKAQLALFVDGCFWHCCPKHCITPANNRAFWKEKLAANKARDHRDVVGAVELDDEVAPPGLAGITASFSVAEQREMQLPAGSLKGRRVFDLSFDCREMTHGFLSWVEGWSWISRDRLWLQQRHPPRPGHTGHIGRCAG